MKKRIELPTKEEKEKLRILAQYGIGIQVISKCDIVKMNKTYLNSVINQLDVDRIREFDQRHETNIQSYNSDIDRSKITHAIDFYRLSNGSIQRKHHSRKNLRFNDNAILLGILVNIKTGKIYYSTWKSDKETTDKAIWLIEKARMHKEKIEYLQSDRVIKKLINGCENLGINVVVYGKRSMCYNSHAERQFGNISKCFYSIIEKFENINKWDQAIKLFRAILEVYYNYDPTTLIQYHKKYEEQQKQKQKAIAQ